jgi:hypothetical protein
MNLFSFHFIASASGVRNLAIGVLVTEGSKRRLRRARVTDSAPADIFYRSEHPGKRGCFIYYSLESMEGEEKQSFLFYI